MTSLKKFKTFECIFCRLKEDDELRYGQIFHREKFSLHYYCMLFSSGLNQRGKTDEDGILGFFPSDILREVRRGKRLKCTYCGKYGATIGCCNKKCKKVFHLPCGLQNDSLSQFFGTFDTFCGVHRPRQKVHIGDGKGSEESDSICSICLYSVDCKVSNDLLRAPCCNYSWFHRTCVQRLALNAGYFFKCPLCNNKDLFNMEMLKYGIHIPEQDASWELEQNAFQDLLERYCHCDAIHCICPNGRNFSSKGSEWEIMVCSSCGSQGCHVLCKEPSTQPFSWMCSGCLTVTWKLQKKRLVKPLSLKIHDDDESLVETSEEDSSSAFTCMSSTVLPQKRSREETIFLKKDSMEFKVFKKENSDLTSVSHFNRRDKKLNGYGVKPMSLGFLCCSQRNEPVVSLQDDISNLNKKVNKGVSFCEERNSELFQISSHPIDNELGQPEAYWEDSLRLSFGKNDSPQRCHNTWKDFNHVNLASNKPVFFQISHGVNPGSSRLEIFMRQGGGKPPVKLGFRNLFVPSAHSNHSKKQVSTVTSEQLLSNSVTGCNDKHQSNCSVPSREVKNIISNSGEKFVHESTSKASSSNSKNYLKESQLSRNVEHYHSAIHHLAYNQGSKLEKQAHDHDIPPTSENKVHPETKHMSHKSFL
ncbi:G2/M phase-specific E3 ubiquitin-protein ligase-like, partial [Limulus polyphemus]|uniref:G2/M phase-specific E3 ubiquitin-protein ligase-like n=1 Tax=Limulus polyphemus TaxID=6850 RepID=A0ABM1SYX4_LIMPO